MSLPMNLENIQINFPSSFLWIWIIQMWNETHKEEREREREREREGGGEGAGQAATPVLELWNFPKVY